MVSEIASAEKQLRAASLGESTQDHLRDVLQTATGMSPLLDSTPSAANLRPRTERLATESSFHWLRAPVKFIH
jgi:hypothetical protein